MADDWAAAMQEQAIADELDSVSTVALDEFQSEKNDAARNSELEVILDIPVSISMVVWRSSITIRNLLQLNQGSVIELHRLAGEPVDVLVNGTLIAPAGVVVVNE